MPMLIRMQAGRNVVGMDSLSKNPLILAVIKGVIIRLNAMSVAE